MGVTITLVRHGETVFNRKNLIHGATAGGLTDTGIDQAIKLGKFLENETFTCVYISDLERCKETLNHTVLQLKTPPMQIVHDSRLRKKDYGHWEGKPLSFMFQASADQQRDTAKVTVPGGQLPEEVMGSMIDFFKQLLGLADDKTQEHENILVVTHGQNIHYILLYLNESRDLFDFREYTLDPNTRGGNTSVTKITIEKPGSVQGEKFSIKFHCVQDKSHLDV